MKYSFKFLLILSFLTLIQLESCLPTTDDPAPEPRAAFVFNVSGGDPLTVTFTNTSQNATSYVWSFGDGGTSTIHSPTHTYSAGGTYQVQLIASGEGGTHTSTSSVVVSEPIDPPAADFDFSANELTVTFTNQSTNSSTYIWSFGDGNSSSDENPVHTYATPGTFTVILTATGEGGVDTNSQSVAVDAPEPIAGFTFSVSGLNVTFTNTSENADSYSWDFGDANTSLGVDPLHTYSSAGEYNVSLTATGAGGSDNVIQSVAVGLTTLSVDNVLLESISISNNGTLLGSVEPNTTGTFVIVSEATNSIGWEIEQEIIAACSNLALGHSGLGGVFTLNNPAETVTLEVDNVVGSTIYFAPFLTNENAEFAHWFVNWNSSSAWESGTCGVNSGFSDVFLGYYLYEPSEVEDVILDKENPISGNYWFYNPDASSFEALTGRYGMTLGVEAVLEANSVNPNVINYPNGKQVVIPDRKVQNREISPIKDYLK